MHNNTVRQTKPLRYYRPKNSDHGSQNINGNTTDTRTETGQQRHVQCHDVHTVIKGMMDSNYHFYETSASQTEQEGGYYSEVAVMYQTEASMPNYESNPHDLGDVDTAAQANTQLQSRGKVLASMKNVTGLNPQKKKPPVKKRTKVPLRNEDRDHPQLRTPLSMYDMVKFEHGGEPENPDITGDQQSSRVLQDESDTKSHGQRGAGKEQSELHYNEGGITQGNELEDVLYYNQRKLKQDSTEIGYYNVISYNDRKM